MTESKETRTLNAFAAISRIPDDYILSAEQMLFEAEAGISRPQKPMGGFRRFLNSGWGAAVISGIVALAVLAFIIHAGVNPPATYEPPVKPAGSTIEMSTEGVNYTIATELEHYPRGAVDITAVLTGKTKGESISTAGGGWHLERLTADRAEVVEIIYPCIAQMYEPLRDEYATLVCSMTALTPLPSGTYRLHATKYDGEKYVSVAWCEFTVGSELYPPEAENSPYNLSVSNTTYGSVNITVTATAKEKGEALPAIGRGWKVVKLAGPANTGNTGITILEYGVEAGDPPDADSYATYTESLILEDPSAWLPGIYRLHDLNSKGESVAHCDFVIYEEGYVPLTTENPDHIVVPGIFLWADNTPMVVLMDYYDELYPEPNPSYAAVAVIYPILLVNDHRDGGSGMDLHSGPIVEVEIGKKITYPNHGDLYNLRVVTEGTLNDVDPDWIIFLQDAGYTIRETAEADLPYAVSLTHTLYAEGFTTLSVTLKAYEAGVGIGGGNQWALYRVEGSVRTLIGSRSTEEAFEPPEVAPDEFCEVSRTVSIRDLTGDETLPAGWYELIYDPNGHAVTLPFTVMRPAEASFETAFPGFRISLPESAYLYNKTDGFVTNRGSEDPGPPEIITDESLPATRTLTVDGQELTLTYWHTESRNSPSDTDHYIYTQPGHDEGEWSILAIYPRGSDQLSRIHYRCRDGFLLKGLPTTRNAAKEVADARVRELMGSLPRSSDYLYDADSKTHTVTYHSTSSLIRTATVSIYKLSNADTVQIIVSLPRYDEGRIQADVRDFNTSLLTDSLEDYLTRYYGDSPVTFEGLEEGVYATAGPRFHYTATVTVEGRRQSVSVQVYQIDQPTE